MKVNIDYDDSGTPYATCQSCETAFYLYDEKTVAYHTCQFCPFCGVRFGHYIGSYCGAGVEVVE